jgi:hypothetical protein
MAAMCVPWHAGIMTSCVMHTKSVPGLHMRLVHSRYAARVEVHGNTPMYACCTCCDARPEEYRCALLAKAHCVQGRLHSSNPYISLMP